MHNLFKNKYAGIKEKSLNKYPQCIPSEIARAMIGFASVAPFIIQKWVKTISIVLNNESMKNRKYQLWSLLILEK